MSVASKESHGREERGRILKKNHENSGLRFSPGVLPFDIRFLQRFRLSFILVSGDQFSWFYKSESLEMDVILNQLSIVLDRSMLSPGVPVVVVFSEST